jgi:hypothetical protein
VPTAWPAAPSTFPAAHDAHDAKGLQRAQPSASPLADLVSVRGPARQGDAPGFAYDRGCVKTRNASRVDAMLSILKSREEKCGTYASQIRSASAAVFSPRAFSHSLGRVEMWRGGGRFGLSVAAPFVWRCPSNLAVAPFPHPAHRTGHADLPHPALGQDLTPSPTTGRCQVRSNARDRSTRTDARVDKLRPCVA